MVFLALLIWNAALFWPSPKPEALIPYSSFLEQVRAGNVSEVLISGPQISGTFAQTDPLAGILGDGRVFAAREGRDDNRRSLTA